jgi:hypothetical protein
MMRCALLVLVLAGCPSKPPTTTGTGSGSGTPPTGVACSSIRAKVEGLYRAEAQQNEPERVEEAVRDNTDMVLRECAKNPAAVEPCVANAQAIDIIEKTCLAPLDEEGTEGEALRK